MAFNAIPTCMTSDSWSRNLFFQTRYSEIIPRWLLNGFAVSSFVMAWIFNGVCWTLFSRKSPLCQWFLDMSIGVCIFWISFVICCCYCVRSQQKRFVVFLFVGEDIKWSYRISKLVDKMKVFASWIKTISKCVKLKKTKHPLSVQIRRCANHRTDFPKSSVTMHTVWIYWPLEEPLNNGHPALAAVEYCNHWAHLPLLSVQRTSEKRWNQWCVSVSKWQL